MGVNPDAWSYCVFQSQVGQLGANRHLSRTAPIHTMSLGAQQLSHLGLRGWAWGFSGLPGLLLKHCQIFQESIVIFFPQIQEGPVLIIGESAMTLQRSPVHSERAACILCYDCGKEICGATVHMWKSGNIEKKLSLSVHHGSGDQTQVGRLAELVCPCSHLARPHIHSWILDRVQAALFLLWYGHWAGPVSYIVDPGLGLVAHLSHKAGPNRYFMAPQKGRSLQGGGSHCLESVYSQALETGRGSG